MEGIEFSVSEPIELLYIEDSPVDAELILRSLRKEGLAINARLAENRETFVHELSEARPDLILSDFHLPSFDGFEALEISKEKYPEVPFIVVSGAVTVMEQLKLLRYQADDLVLKDNLTRLPFAVVHALTNARNRNRLHNALKELRESNKEKEVLLAEIHHRVKNNLAVIASFLELQRMYSENTEYKALVANILLKVKSIALVHEKLYQSSNLSVVNMTEFIPDLLEYLKGISLPPERRITISQEGDGLELNINQAIPCGLIISELVNNAVKHAFPNGEKGMVRVEYGRAENRVWFRVSDNGVGMKEDTHQAERTSQGLIIIQALIRQLNADITINGENGTTVEFTFENDWQKKGSSSNMVKR